MTGKLKWAPDGPQSTFVGPSGPATVLHWVRERWAVQRGEGITDEIIRRGRFCCVRREDDRNTRWLHKHWLEPHRDNPEALFFLALVFRACINDGRVAGEISIPFPWDAERYRAEMQARKATGKNTEHFGHHAYTINAPREYAAKFEGHVACLLGPAWESRAHLQPNSADTCASFCERLCKLPGIGPFVAGQIVADCKFFPPLCHAPDTMTFAVPGPGSRRGLARVLGKSIQYYPENGSNDAQWARDFDALRQQLAPELEQILGAPLAASNFQSCLCEVDKLERFRIDHGALQAYTPFGAEPAKKTKAPRPTITTTEDIQNGTAVSAATPTPHALPELTERRDPNAPHVLFHDLETRSTADLKAVGTYRYASDPGTSVLCLAYAVDDEPVQLWAPGAPVPSEFVDAARNPAWTIVAHNDAFERLASHHILEPRHGFPVIPIERRRCSMAMALAAALPGALDKATEALGLPHEKDKAGQALMRRMTKPLPGGAWIEEAASREALFAYCRKDVEAERALFRALPPLTADEQKVWELDATINWRGFYTDPLLLEAAHTVVTTAEAALQSEFREITGLDSTNQTAKLIAWLAEHDCIVTDVQKGTLRHALRRKGLTPEVRRALELRLELAHASAAKVEALRAWRGDDGRVRGTFKYHGAGTGRWTGHGPQPQNFKRDSEGLAEKIGAVMNGGAGLESPVGAVGDIARAMICAAPGHRLLIGDFSGIESRVLAWVSGQHSKVEQWAEFDRTQDPEVEPYAVLGRALGFSGELARTIGKTADLAFGYMGGAGAWQKLAPADDASTEIQIKRRQQAWHAAHPETVRFWHALNRAALQAVAQPGQAFPCKRVAFTCKDEFLRMMLPSGRELAYLFPRTITTNRGDRAVSFKSVDQAQWTDCRHGHGAYGGTWTENAVQAIRGNGE
jgi:DNA polymerase